MSNATPLTVATECAQQACLILWAIPDFATELRAVRDTARDALAEATRRHRELAAQLAEIRAGDIA